MVTRRANSGRSCRCRPREFSDFGQKNGRHERTRTADLFRVKHSLNRHNNKFHGTGRKAESLQGNVRHNESTAIVRELCTEFRASGKMFTTWIRNWKRLTKLERAENFCARSYLSELWECIWTFPRLRIRRASVWNQPSRLSPKPCLSILWMVCSSLLRPVASMLKKRKATASRCPGTVVVKNSMGLYTGPNAVGIMTSANVPCMFFCGRCSTPPVTDIVDSGALKCFDPNLMLTGS